MVRPGDQIPVTQPLVFRKSAPWRGEPKGMSCLTAPGPAASVSGARAGHIASPAGSWRSALSSFSVPPWSGF
jgi:hypothetical protein